MPVSLRTGDSTLATWAGSRRRTDGHKVGAGEQARGATVGAYEDTTGAAWRTPRGSGWSGARDRLGRRPPGRSTPPRPPFYRWFPDGGAEHLPQRARPARRGRPRRPGGADLRPPVTGTRGPTPTRSCATRSPRFAGRARRARRGHGRPGGDLHADGPRGRRRDAGLRPARRGPLGGVRRVRPAGARGPDRRRHPEGDRVGVLRHRGQARHRRTSRCWTGRSSWPSTSRASA